MDLPPVCARRCTLRVVADQRRRTTRTTAADGPGIDADRVVDGAPGLGVLTVLRRIGRTEETGQRVLTGLRRRWS